MRAKFFTFLAISFCFLSWKHEYHVSITQLDYNTKSSTIQVSMKLHTEDIQLVLKRELEGTFNLEKDLERKEVEEYFRKYIKRSFSVSHNNSPVRLNFIGREFEDDDLWIYMESSEFSELPELEVKNTLFLEVFNDQTNMVHYSKDNQMIQSAVLNKQKRVHSFTLN